MTPAIRWPNCARICTVLVAVAAVCVPPLYPQPRAAAKAAPGKAKFVTYKQLTRDQMEHFLTTAQIVSERAVEKGIAHTFRVTMTDGKYYHDAHVQTLDMFRPEFRVNNVVEKNFTDSYKYNIAAYRLDKIMDLNMVPVCVPRVVHGKPAAVDWWVDDVLFDEEGRREKNAEPPDLNMWSKQLNDVRDFDQLIWNEDRNQGNLLIDKDWKVWAIDHSRSFREYPTLRDPKVLRRISNKLLQAMKNLDEQTLEANLMPYVSKAAIEALLARRDLLVRFFETEISQKGSDVVLTDLPRRTERVTIP